MTHPVRPREVHKLSVVLVVGVEQARRQLRVAALRRGGRANDKLAGVEVPGRRNVRRVARTLDVVHAQAEVQGQLVGRFPRVLHEEIHRVVFQTEDPLGVLPVVMHAQQERCDVEPRSARIARVAGLPGVEPECPAEPGIRMGALYVFSPELERMRAGDMGQVGPELVPLVGSELTGIRADVAPETGYRHAGRVQRLRQGAEQALGD